MPHPDWDTAGGSDDAPLPSSSERDDGSSPGDGHDDDDGTRTSRHSTPSHVADHVAALLSFATAAAQEADGHSLEERGRFVWGEGHSLGGRVHGAQAATAGSNGTPQIGGDSMLTASSAGTVVMRQMVASHDGVAIPSGHIGGEEKQRRPQPPWHERELRYQLAGPLGVAGSGVHSALVYPGAHHLARLAQLQLHQQRQSAAGGVSARVHTLQVPLNDQTSVSVSGRSRSVSVSSAGSASTAVSHSSSGSSSSGSGSADSLHDDASSVDTSSADTEAGSDSDESSSSTGSTVCSGSVASARKESDVAGSIAPLASVGEGETGLPLAAVAPAAGVIEEAAVDVAATGAVSINSSGKAGAGTADQLLQHQRDDDAVSNASARSDNSESEDASSHSGSSLTSSSSSPSSGGTRSPDLTSDDSRSSASSDASSPTSVSSSGSLLQVGLTASAVHLGITHDAALPISLYGTDGVGNQWDWSFGLPPMPYTHAGMEDLGLPFDFTASFPPDSTLSQMSMLSSGSLGRSMQHVEGDTGEGFVQTTAVGGYAGDVSALPLSQTQSPFWYTAPNSLDSPNSHPNPAHMHPLSSNSMSYGSYGAEEDTGDGSGIQDDSPGAQAAIRHAFRPLASRTPAPSRTHPILARGGQTAVYRNSTGAASSTAATSAPRKYTRARLPLAHAQTNDGATGGTMEGSAFSPGISTINSSPVSRGVNGAVTAGLALPQPQPARAPRPSRQAHPVVTFNPVATSRASNGKHADKGLLTRSTRLSLPMALPTDVEMIGAYGLSHACAHSDPNVRALAAAVVSQQRILETKAIIAQTNYERLLRTSTCLATMLQDLRESVATQTALTHHVLGLLQQHCTRAVAAPTASGATAGSGTTEGKPKRSPASAAAMTVLSRLQATLGKAQQRSQARHMQAVTSAGMPDISFVHGDGAMANTLVGALKSRVTANKAHRHGDTHLHSAHEGVPSHLPLLPAKRKRSDAPRTSSSSHTHKAKKERTKSRGRRTTTSAVRRSSASKHNTSTGDNGAAAGPEDGTGEGKVEDHDEHMVRVDGVGDSRSQTDKLKPSRAATPGIARAPKKSRHRRTSGSRKRRSRLRTGGKDRKAKRPRTGSSRSPPAAIIHPHHESEVAGDGGDVEVTVLLPPLRLSDSLAAAGGETDEGGSGTGIDSGAVDGFGSTGISPVAGSSCAVATADSEVAMPTQLVAAQT